MRLLISMRVVENDSYPEQRDALTLDWPAYFAAEFPEVLLVPVLNRPEGVKRLFEELSAGGLVLSNGNDIGQAPLRDETERLLIDYCLEHRLPVLGFCRGLQMINVYFGGELVTDIVASGKKSHVAVEHPVQLNNRFFAELAPEGPLSVNSFHNQGVTLDSLAGQLEAFAVSGDGIVEGLFHPGAPVLAVQWHPERQGGCPEFNRRLIGTFLHEGRFWH